MPITAIGFVLVFILGSLVAFKKPFVGILLYFFCFYMHPPGKYWGAYLPEIRWTLIVAVITLISVFINEKHKGVWLKFKETKLLIAFIIFVGIQFPFVLNVQWHQIYFILLLKLLVLYFLLITVVNTEKRLVTVIVANLIGCAYIGFTALQMHFGGRFEKAGLPSIDDSNLLAIHVIPIVIISAFLFLSDYFKKKKYWLLIPLAFAANLIIMTGSRGGIGALLATGVFLIVFSPSEFRGKLMKWGIVALLSLSFVSMDLIINRIKTITDADETTQVDKSAESRLVIINAQFEMFKDSILLGEGHRTTLILSPFYIDEKYLTNTSAGAVRGSHNLTMAMLVDHGLIGFLLYFWIIFLAIYSTLKISKNKENVQSLRMLSLGLSGAIVSMLVASQFSNSKVLEISIWLVALSVIIKNLTMSHFLEPHNEKNNDKFRT